MTGTSFLAQIATVLPNLRNRFALIGLVVAVAGFVATRVVAPEYVHAQIAAGTIGVLFLVFGQVFHHLGSFPEAERTRLITRLFLVFVALVLALIGLTGYFLQSQNAFRTVVNAKYLASLVGKEPFTEVLPRPLVQSGFGDVQINDSSAAGRLSAVQVKLAPDPVLARGFGNEIQVFAHIEVYPTEESARKRSSASMALLAAQYQVGAEPMSPESFCVDGGAFWTCAGHRGLAYAEVTLSPGPNAYRGVATGTLSALLGYSNKIAALATN
jgi:hypothetical protein